MGEETVFLSTTEAAVRLGITRQRVLQLIEAGGLPATKVGNGYIIRQDDLHLVAERKPGRPPKGEESVEQTVAAPSKKAVTKKASTRKSSKK